jgi:hypothetical protein
MPHQRQYVPTSNTANKAGANPLAGTASIPSALTKVIGTKVVKAASKKIQAKVEYSAPRSIEKAILAGLKIVGENEMAKLVANESDCAICLCPLDGNDKEDTGNGYAGYISSVNSARRQEKRRIKAKKIGAPSMRPCIPSGMYRTVHCKFGESLSLQMYKNGWRSARKIPQWYHESGKK